jgi:hypothetical protein
VRKALRELSKSSLPEAAIAKYGLTHYVLWHRGDAMTNKSAKAEMMQAHEDIAAALDAKLSTMPEWRAFRALDRALLALEAEPEPAPAPKAIPSAHRPRLRLNGAHPSYMSLADKALSEAGKPVSTADIFAYIAARRPLSSDADKARIVIQSSLSKDKRFESVPWAGRRAWWYAGRQVPAQR